MSFLSSNYQDRSDYFEYSMNILVWCLCKIQWVDIRRFGFCFCGRKIKNCVLKCEHFVVMDVWYFCCWTDVQFLYYCTGTVFRRILFCIILKFTVQLINLLPVPKGTVFKWVFFWFVEFIGSPLRSLLFLEDCQSDFQELLYRCSQHHQSNFQWVEVQIQSPNHRSKNFQIVIAQQ